jgi:hypothetical protein
MGGRVVDTHAGACATLASACRNKNCVWAYALRRARTMSGSSTASGGGSSAAPNKAPTAVREERLTAAATAAPPVRKSRRRANMRRRTPERFFLLVERCQADRIYLFLPIYSPFDESCIVNLTRQRSPSRCARISFIAVRNANKWMEKSVAIFIKYDITG